MLLKLIFLATVTVGVLGRSTFDLPNDDELYSEYNKQVAAVYCNATHAEDKTSEVEFALNTFTKCLTRQINYVTFMTELQEADGNGTYEGVIKKYCAKASQLKECAHDLVDGMAPCLSTSMVRIATKSINTLADFVCDNEGARIALFVKEGGPQCFRDVIFDIVFCQKVLMSNVSKLANVSGDELAGILAISDQDTCALTDQGLTCLANALKYCPKPTPGILAQELHDTYLENISCSEITRNTATEAVGGTETSGYETVSSDINKSIDGLKKMKLLLEVRNAELEIWHRENELNVQHTILTSDVKTKA